MDSSHPHVAEVLADNPKLSEVEVSLPYADDFLKKKDVTSVLEETKGSAGAIKVVLASEYECLERIVSELQVFQASFQRSSQVLFKIRMRSLVEQVREKIHGHQLSEEEKTRWNNDIEHMTDQQLQQLHLSRQQLLLTRFSGRSIQKQGNQAAHSCTAQAVAISILECPHSNTPDLEALFVHVYGCSPAEALEDDDGLGW